MHGKNRKAILERSNIVKHGGNGLTFRIDNDHFTIPAHWA